MANAAPLFSRFKSRTAGEPGYDTSQAGTHVGCIFIEPTLVIDEVHRCKEQDDTRKEQGLTSRMEEAHEVVACAQHILTKNGRKKQARGDDMKGDTNPL